MSDTTETKFKSAYERWRQQLCDDAWNGVPIAPMGYETLYAMIEPLFEALELEAHETAMDAANTSNYD